MKHFRRALLGMTLATVSVSAWAQDIIVSGAVTDLDGHFSFKAPQGSLLVVSYIGYATQELKAGSNMTIELKENTKQLNEVVVTGYTSEKKADLTGSVAVVKMKDIADVPTGNVLQSLNGRVAGVNITTDGTPGGNNTSTLVRGTTTINNSSPLYVIDGVMTRDGVGSILSSNDVESIQVLKDASSAAIYGAQAANGVIIITTKRAKKGETKVDFNASLTLQQFVNNYDLLDANQWGEVYWQAYKNTYGVHPNSLIYGNGDKPVLNTTTPYFTGAKGQTYTATNTNWLDLMYKTALMQDYSVTLSRATDKGATSLSVNWIDQDGMLKNTDYQRINTRLTTDYSSSTTNCASVRAWPSTTGHSTRLRAALRNSSSHSTRQSLPTTRWADTAAVISTCSMISPIHCDCRKIRRTTSTSTGASSEMLT